MIIVLALFLSIPPSVRDSLLCRTEGNRETWEILLDSCTDDTLRCVEYLFTEISRLDRLEMTEEMLLEHVGEAIDSRGLFYDSIPDSLFLAHLVSYRIDLEPVSSYRKRLREFWAERLDLDPSDPVGAADSLRNRLSSLVEEIEHDFLGGIAAPLKTLETGMGTEREIRVLLGASLKSLGIAARPVQGWFREPEVSTRRWLEVWDGSSWLPMDYESETVPALAMATETAENLTPGYGPVGWIVIRPGSASVDSEATLYLSLAADRRLVPLDYIELDPLRADTVCLGEGDFVLQAARRLDSGPVRMRLRTVRVETQDTLLVDVSDITGEL